MEQSRPISKTLRDSLVEYTAEELELDERLCDRVISWVYERTKKATTQYKTIEISGFGKLYVGAAKLRRRINRWNRKVELLEDMSVLQNEETRAKKLSAEQEMLEFLKTKQ